MTGFFVRKDAKSHGTGRILEGLAEGESLKGKRIVVLDDVTTTGGSAMTAVSAAQDEGSDVMLVLSIIDLAEGALEYYDGRRVPFASLFKAREFMLRPCLVSDIIP